MILFCWLFMQWTHELGHVVGALLTSGEVDLVVLHPFRFSRTDIHPNPSPMFVVWAGPIGGCIFGCLLSLLWLGIGKNRRYLMFVSAGFCVLANAVYIGIGALVPEADAAVMVSLGTPKWVMAAFGLLAGLPGYWLIRRGVRVAWCAERSSKSWLIDLAAVSSLTLILSAVGYLLFPGP